MNRISYCSYGTSNNAAYAQNKSWYNNHIVVLLHCQQTQLIGGKVANTQNQSHMPQNQETPNFRDESVVDWRLLFALDRSCNSHSEASMNVELDS